MSFAADYLACLRFYSRLPVPAFAFEPAPYAMLDFGRAVRMLPFAGATIGAIGGGVLLAATELGLPVLPAAAFAVAALALATGAFHEDGLADSADGLGGGRSVERKLEIMKDSRIGTFGGAALCLSLLLRTLLLAEIAAAQDGVVAALALVASGAASRVAALAPLVLLPPARTDGAAYAADKPRAGPLVAAVAGALVFGLAPALAEVAVGRLFVGMAAMLGAALVMTEIARRQIKGQTGDIGGAAQQLAEIAFLTILASRP